MLLITIFMLSLSSLAFEILLTRVFSIGQWNHLSFMVISIALFGFGASGTVLSLLGAKRKGWEERLTRSPQLKTFIFLYTMTGLVSFAVLNQIPLDYFRLPIEPVQSVYLFVVYLLLSLPFFLSGLIISLAYAKLPEKTGRIYWVSMAGSACGALLPFFLLPLLGEGRLILLVMIIPLWLILLKEADPAHSDRFKKRIRLLKTIVSLFIGIGISVILGVVSHPLLDAMINVDPSPYKALSHLLQYPNTEIIETATSLRGRIDRVKSVHLHVASGLSLTFPGPLPEQTAVFNDGGNRLILYNRDAVDTPEDRQFARFTLSFAGYRLLPSPGHVLLIQQGGGLAIPCALSSGAGKISIVESNPHIARIIKRHYDLPVINTNPRGFLAGTQDRFDIIHVDNLGSPLPGTSVLKQEYLFTIETVSEYLNHLNDQGILTITRKLHLPPSDIIRLWAVAYESLKSNGIDHPERHILVLRNWDTFTLLVSPGSFSDRGVLKTFARDLNFDWVYAPGMRKEMANHFNVFDEPFHYLALRDLEEAYREGKADQYFKQYLLDVSPQSDHRPFPNRFLKWSRLKAIYKSTGSRFYSLIMSGEIIVAVVFIEALVLSILLLLLPLFSLSKHRNGPLFPLTLFFFSIGAGFMFLELFFIKAFLLLFGNPTISFTMVLAGILIFSGIGGFCSQWMRLKDLRYALFGLAIVLILLFIGLDRTVHYLLRFPGGLQYLFAFLLLFPPGFLIGLPFTLGMRYLLKTPAERAYAWAVNGCASVLASIASMQIALSLGIPMILVCAFIAYVLAFLSMHTALMTSQKAEITFFRKSCN